METEQPNDKPYQVSIFIPADHVVRISSNEFGGLTIEMVDGNCVYVDQMYTVIVTEKQQNTYGVKIEL